MNQDICQVHGTPKKLVPAGKSKLTNKPFKAFFSCDQCWEAKKAQNSVKQGNSNDSGASSDKFEAIMSSLGDLSAQITDLRFLVEDVNKKLK